MHSFVLSAKVNSVFSVSVCAESGWFNLWATAADYSEHSVSSLA
ncbi:hypothetical protein SOHN41_03585 [Shewanella sp. HN-41]|nr:hypothetical protein SOHN41_03585 [Shewanella sp. HN-41]